MTFADRLAAVAKFGFTERQARFLVTVMVHSGLCVPRQYAAIAGTAYGHKVTRFFERLVTRQYAVECGCLHNRAALYQVRYQQLYRAIEQAHSRYRRPVSARHAIARLMRLDAVIASRDLHWLGSAEEKVALCSRIATSCPRERLPHRVIDAASSPRMTLFPDDVPMGVSSTGRLVFVFVLPMPDGDFRACLQRHADLLRALPEWTIQLVFPRDAANRVQTFEAAAREELTMQLSPRSFAELTWYCNERKSTPDSRIRSRTDARFARARGAFATARYELLYRRWLTGGDPVLDLVSSTAIGDALERRTGRIEPVILPFSYRHLVPLVALPSSQEGVEEGERTSGSSQPPSALPLTTTVSPTTD